MLFLRYNNGKGGKKIIGYFLLGGKGGGLWEDIKEKSTNCRKLLLLLKRDPRRQHSKMLYRWRVRRKVKTGNHGKLGVKRKW